MSNLCHFCRQRRYLGSGTKQYCQRYLPCHLPPPPFASASDHVATDVCDPELLELTHHVYCARHLPRLTSSVGRRNTLQGIDTICSDVTESEKSAPPFVLVHQTRQPAVFHSSQRSPRHQGNRSFLRGEPGRICHHGVANRIHRRRQASGTAAQHAAHHGLMHEPEVGNFTIGGKEVGLLEAILRLSDLFPGTTSRRRSRAVQGLARKKTDKDVPRSGSRSPSPANPCVLGINRAFFPLPVSPYYGSKSNLGRA